MTPDSATVDATFAALCDGSSPEDELALDSCLDGRFGTVPPHPSSVTAGVEFPPALTRLLAEQDLALIEIRRSLVGHITVKLADLNSCEGRGFGSEQDAWRQAGLALARARAVYQQESAVKQEDD